MSRGLVGLTATTVADEVVERTVAVELLFDSGPLRAAGTPFDLVLAGLTFVGVGQLGGVSVVEETAELQAQGLTLQLAGIPRDLVALALQQTYQGRRATVFEVPFLPTGEPIGSIVLFRGRMDQMDIALGDTATVRVQLENRLADWDRARASRYTNEEQQRRYPGDKGLEFVPSTTETDLVWPAASFWNNR